MVCVCRRPQTSTEAREKSIRAALKHIRQSSGCDILVASSDLATTPVLVQYLHVEPSETLGSSGSKQNTSKPDGYLVLKQRLEKDSVLWPDIVLPCEYKNTDGKNCLIDVSTQRGL